VIWRRSPPSDRMVQIFGTVPNVPWTIAMRVPSGDQTGSNE
jgi:hypothetical protein